MDVVQRAEPLRTEVGAGLIIHGVLLLLKAAGRNSPSVMVPESFTATTPSGSRVFTVGGTQVERIHFPERPCGAVRVPERLAGRLAPSVLTVT
jgi:hypothetical protein